MSEIITLSSDEETDSPKTKRLKLGPLNVKNCVIIKNELSSLKGRETASSTNELFEKGDEEMCKNFVISDVKSLSSENDNLPVITEVISLSEEEKSEIRQDEVKEVNLEKFQVSNLENLNKFLDICTQSVENSKFSRLLDYIPKIRSNFEQNSNFESDSVLSKSLQDNIEKAKKSASNAVTSFKEIFFYLSNPSTREFQVTEDEKVKLKKLERAMRLILKKLKRLGESEILSEDDENSPYIQSDRYAQRLTKIYAKYCSMLNLNQYSGRLIYQKVAFQSSKYEKINLAISKTYKNNKFPSYYDIEKCIRECITQNDDLNLTEAEIVTESTHCFKKLGALLQNRRKKELYDYHSDFIRFSEDLAKDNPEMDQILRQHYKESQTKMDELLETYTRNQENNVPANENDKEEDNSDSSDTE